VHEGEDAVVTIKVAGGPPDQPPTIQWIKGKWSELKGPNYEMRKNLETMEYTLVFKKPKMHDAGSYKVKAISAAGDHDSPFSLKILSQQMTKSDGKGASGGKPDMEADADAAFKKRMKRM